MKSAAWLAIDTEADSLHAYPEKVCLIQISTAAGDRLVPIPGQPPNLLRMPSGCAFAPRCELAMARCREEYPPLEKFGADHWAACWRAAETVRLP